MLRAQGQSYRQIAARLNQEGHRTVTGKRWGAVQMRTVVLRGASASPGPVGAPPLGTF
ncbi:recombinase family protein [Deinococcus yunweiensis]|uniref:recombinase family protein n=1 Tax=Deinococcus yunweiensis TaxID=367282 RepID=UPI00398E69AC